MWPASWPQARATSRGDVRRRDEAQWTRRSFFFFIHSASSCLLTRPRHLARSFSPRAIPGRRVGHRRER
jgi:hypothetical protein